MDELVLQRGIYSVWRLSDGTWRVLSGETGLERYFSLVLALWRLGVLLEKTGFGEPRKGVEDECSSGNGRPAKPDCRGD